MERIVLALSLSLVATALASLVLYTTSVGLTLGSWAAALAVITAAATVTAAARLSPSRDLPPPPPGMHRFALRPRIRPLAVAIAVAAAGLAAAAVVLARTPLGSPSARGYTALWLTRDSRSPALILGVRSDERQTTRYVLRLRLSGRTSRRHLALAPGQTWQERLPLTRQAAASLYRVGHPGVYRSARLGAAATTGR